MQKPKVTKDEILNSVFMSKHALETSNEDIGHLRFLVNKMGYELRNVLTGNLKRN